MHDEGTDSRVKIFANIFISFIGAGILGLPYAFREVGKTIDTCRLLEYFNNHNKIIHEHIPYDRTDGLASCVNCVGDSFLMLFTTTNM